MYLQQREGLCYSDRTASNDEDALETTPEKAAEALAAGAVLLDVREPFELDIVKVEGATHIPMRSVPQRLDELPEGADVYVLCHHGGRSFQVTQFLRAQGVNATNVAGGIELWAQTVDPSLARY